MKIQCFKTLLGWDILYKYPWPLTNNHSHTLAYDVPKTCFWLVETDHVTWTLAFGWSSLFLYGDHPGRRIFILPRVNEWPLEIFSVKLRYLVELVTKQLCQNFNAIIQGYLFVKTKQIWIYPPSSKLQILVKSRVLSYLNENVTLSS